MYKKRNSFLFLWENGKNKKKKHKQTKEKNQRNVFVSLKIFQETFL